MCGRVGRWYVNHSQLPTFLRGGLQLLERIRQGTEAILEGGQLPPLLHQALLVPGAGLLEEVGLPPTQLVGVQHLGQRFKIAFRATEL